jgi:hypothetical protein
MKYPSGALFFLIVLYLILCASCRKYTCSTPAAIMMSIQHYDTVTGDTFAVIDVFAGGSGLNSAPIFSAHAAILRNISWDPPRGYVKYDFLFGYNYKVIFLPSGTTHKLQNLAHGNYSTSYMGFGEASHCVNSFSYTLDGHNYSQPQIGLGHSNMTSLPYYSILVD